ncbi:hypothetical protein [Micavibrio aeruginosavorus]|uniref:Tip attachment protein J domain-containing protein n=1 Tax=Micavibrio aeruginosavorus (strain ARL-13) TaxID=856793 RepID=G2KLQ4_MICAA|nr:hypothetical protein [Micavibrio aeruginosavorus]AEP08884.1 hypothetical protein MICA_547 [Micavibrio aeruginosavorus ARL-13]
MFAPFGFLPYGYIPPEYDNSVPDPFRALLSEPDIQLRYLIELHPYDESNIVEHTWLPAPIGWLPFGYTKAKTLGGIETVYLSDMKFITEPTDTPANQYFAPVVNNPLQFDFSILRGEEFGISSPSFGAIQIQNGNGDFDYLAGLSWKGRRIVVKAGGPSFKYSQFTTVFDGLCNAIEFDDDVITLTIRDNGLKIDQDIVSATYDGTGGLEGGDDLSGKMKPLLYGEAFNIEPVLVDPVNLIYQIHAGPMMGVDAVYDKGALLAFDEDVTDIAEAAPDAGKYATSLSSGFIKLGSTPAGRITADAHGDSAGGYVSSAADIARRLVMTKLGIQSFSATEIDGAAFNRLDDEIPGAMGLYITEKAPIRNFLDALINPCGAYWNFGRTGMLTAGYVDDPGVEIATINASNIDTSGIEAPAPISPAWRISVAYAPAWVVQKEDELAGSATDGYRTFVGQDYRTVVSEDRSVRTRNAQAVERVFYTTLADKADAESLLARLVRIYGVERKIYRVPSYGTLFRLYVGDPVKLEYPRFNINKNLSVVGISEDAETNQTTLELWG